MQELILAAPFKNHSVTHFLSKDVGLLCDNILIFLVLLRDLYLISMMLS